MLRGLVAAALRARHARTRKSRRVAALSHPCPPHRSQSGAEKSTNPTLVAFGPALPLHVNAPQTLCVNAARTLSTNEARTAASLYHLPVTHASLSLAEGGALGTATRFGGGGVGAGGETTRVLECSILQYTATYCNTETTRVAAIGDIRRYFEVNTYEVKECFLMGTCEDKEGIPPVLDAHLGCVAARCSGCVAARCSGCVAARCSGCVAAR